MAPQAQMLRHQGVELLDKIDGLSFADKEFDTDQDMWKKMLLEEV